MALTACQNVQVIQLVNTEREGNGLRPVLEHPELTAKAQRWANTMAAAGQISHSNLSEGVGVGWHILGENVGVAPDIVSVHRAFMGSPSHRENLLNPRFTHIGTGVAQAPNGMWYVAQVFGA